LFCVFADAAVEDDYVVEGVEAFGAIFSDRLAPEADGALRGVLGVEPSVLSSDKGVPLVADLLVRGWRTINFGGIESHSRHDKLLLVECGTGS